MLLMISTKEKTVSVTIGDDAPITGVMESVTTLLSGIGYHLRSIRGAYYDEAERMETT